MASSAGAAQMFRVGQEATARVIGSRLLDGMAVVSLKPSVVQQTLMSYDELAAGQKARPAAKPAAGAPAVLPHALHEQQEHPFTAGSGAAGPWGADHRKDRRN